MNGNKVKLILGVAFAGLTIIAASGVLVGLAIGSFKTVDHTATGVAASPPPTTNTYTFDLFEANGTTPLALPVQWGNVVVGTPSTKTIVVKNTGNQTYSVVLDTSSVPSGWTITGTVAGLAPGASANMTLTLSTTAVGAVSFPTNFNAVY